MPQKHLVIDDAIPYAQAIFSHLGKITLLPGREINAAICQNADALIVRSRTQVNAELLQDSRVQFVGSTVVGLDHIDQAWLKQQGITFYSAQGCNANSVAEYILAALFEIAQQKQLDLRQQTLGIIGVGHVGKRLEQKAKALGIKLLLNDPPRAEREGHQAETPFVSLDQLLAQADIITLHTPLTQDGDHPTYQLLNSQNLKHIQPHAILINAARGGIIDEQAWLTLNNRANIIDCWQSEPLINAALYQKADIATAHIAGHSLEAKVAGSSMVYHQLCQAWSITPQTDWQAQLPPNPAPLSLDPQADWQSALHQIIKQTYDIIADDHAIRSDDIQQVHAQFETHRRHYPIRREWAQHSVFESPNPTINHGLKNLNFRLIMSR